MLPGGQVHSTHQHTVQGGGHLDGHTFSGGGGTSENGGDLLSSGGGPGNIGSSGAITADTVQDVNQSNANLSDPRIAGGTQ